MTERQINLLYAAACRARCRERAEELSDTNRAFVGGKKADDHLRNLNEAGKR